MSDASAAVSVVKGATPPGAGREPIEAERARRSDRVTVFVQEQGGFVVLAVVFVAACAFSGGFASSDNFKSILVGNAYTSLLALGMTFVIISGGIDLSVGSMFALGGVLAGWGTLHGGTGVAIVLPIAVGLAFGAVQGLHIAYARLAPSSSRSPGCSSPVACCKR